jgi:pimeloyl-ACP methyl ester carboxylesterase
MRVGFTEKEFTDGQYCTGEKYYQGIAQITLNSKEEIISYRAAGNDAYVENYPDTEWHQYKIQLRPDGIVLMYRDGQLKYTSSTPLDLSTYDLTKFQHWGQASYGPMLIDDIKISSGSSGDVIKSTINGKDVNWLLLNGQNLDPISGIPSNNSSSRIPIVLVHGNRSESEPRARWTTFINKALSSLVFNKYKFDIWIWIHNTPKAIGFNGHTGNGAELADCINNYILPYYKRGTKATLVAHSRGGLVCRSFMNYDNDGDGDLDGDRISGLITLATPHHGSPGGVPDWAAFSFSEGLFDIPPIVYNQTYGTNKTFDPFRLGDLNLAWDNMDGAKPYSTRISEYDVNISAHGYMHFSPRDMNEPSSAQFQDATLFYKDQWDSPNYKGQFGTLVELNQKEKYKNKIVTFAAYDDDYSNNLEWHDLVGAFLFKLEHDSLEAATLVLGGFDVNDVTREGIKFYANDGLVPIQSALFLDISDGSTFCTKNIFQKISLNDDIIKSHKQVRKHRIYTGNIKDHLDLLDTIDSDYWQKLISDIIDLNKKPVPWIPTLLLGYDTTFCGTWSETDGDNGTFCISLNIYETIFNGKFDVTKLTNEGGSYIYTIAGTRAGNTYQGSDSRNRLFTFELTNNYSFVSGSYYDPDGGETGTLTIP